MNLSSAKPFVPAPPTKPVDKVGDNLKKLGIEQDDDISKVKDILKTLQEGRKDKAKAISLDIFKQFADLKLCAPTDGNIKKSMNVGLMKREVKENKAHAQKQMQKGRSDYMDKKKQHYNKGNQRFNDEPWTREHIEGKNELKKSA